VVKVPKKVSKKITRNILLSGHYIVVNCKNKSFEHFTGIPELKKYFEDQFAGKSKLPQQELMEELKNYIVFRGIMSPIKFKYKNQVDFLVGKENNNLESSNLNDSTKQGE
jgi:hypothetical protein